jgi:hypothetical protein
MHGGTGSGGEQEIPLGAMIFGSALEDPPLGKMGAGPGLDSHRDYFPKTISDFGHFDFRPRNILFPCVSQTSSKYPYFTDNSLTGGFVVYLQV